MAHAQKPDLVLLKNERVHLNRRWASVQSTTVSRGVRISGNNVGYTVFRGSVKGTGYPLNWPGGVRSVDCRQPELCAHQR